MTNKERISEMAWYAFLILCATIGILIATLP